MRVSFDSRLVGEDDWTVVETPDLPAHLVLEWLGGWWNIPGSSPVTVRNFVLIRDEV